MVEEMTNETAANTSESPCISPRVSCTCRPESDTTHVFHDVSEKMDELRLFSDTDEGV